MKLGDMFAREWKCEAPVWPDAKCTAEERSDKLQHTECGWRFEPDFDAEEWHNFKYAEVVLISDEEIDQRLEETKKTAGLT